MARTRAFWGQEGSAITTYANPFNYNASGLIEKMRLGNGKWETAPYNNRLQATKISLGAGSNNSGLLKLEYDYGNNTQNNGSLREQKIIVPNAGGTVGFTAIQTYTYDDLNRLQQAKEMVGATETWKQTFTIDRYGNREFDAANTTTLGSCTQAVCNPDISTANNRFSSLQARAMRTIKTAMLRRTPKANGLHMMRRTIRRSSLPLATARTIRTRPILTTATAAE